MLKEAISNKGFDTRHQGRTADEGPQKSIPRQNILQLRYIDNWTIVNRLDTPSVLQKKGPQSNASGPLPSDLRAGVENLSGLDMTDVRVIRDSHEPAKLDALAYAQGSNIHIGPGQDKHLPHEAWHVVQQKQGRVTPTTQYANLPGNDDQKLEREAEGMGRLATQAPKQMPKRKGRLRTETADGSKMQQLFKGGVGRTTEVIQRSAWDAIAGRYRDIIDLPAPIEQIFDDVVATNRLMASRISIPGSWRSALLEYATAHPVDGAILLAAIGRLPSFFRGGWIMDVQPGAAAMTLDHSIFVPKGSTLSLATYVHELVHVFQFGVTGVTAFLVSYFGTSAATIAYRWLRGLPTRPFRSSPHEEQAYSLESRFNSWYSGKHGRNPNHIIV